MPCGRGTWAVNGAVEAFQANAHLGHARHAEERHPNPVFSGRQFGFKGVFIHTRGHLALAVGAVKNHFAAHRHQHALVNARQNPPAQQAGFLRGQDGRKKSRARGGS